MAYGSDKWKASFKDYDTAKQRYLEGIKIRPIKTGLLTTNEGIQKIIKDIENNVIKTDKFIFEMKLGKKTLHQKRKHRYLRVLSEDEVFDVALRHHITHNHRNVEETVTKLRKKYTLSLRNVRAALHTCTRCFPEGPPLDVQFKLPQGKTWRMNILSYATKDTYTDVLSYLLFYKENMTNFVVLRPIPSEGEGMIITLLRIFLEFGPPSTLLVPDKRDFYENLLQKPVTMGCPVEVSVKLAPAEVIANDASEVVTELNNWCKGKSQHWEIGCHIVQLKMNTTKKKIIRIGAEDIVGTPYDLMFSE